MIYILFNFKFYKIQINIHFVIIQNDNKCIETVQKLKKKKPFRQDVKNTMW